MPYRADIDGLRALSVVAVILFHAGVPWLAGGFVGVDVFFVISGFLIASLILHEQESGTFTLVGFYHRRVRRILPALFVMLAVCAAVGWFVLSPFNYLDLGRSIFAAVFSISNIKFWAEAGYFDATPWEKPLLHTWSLGVEEQFYLVFPLYMILVARRLRPWRVQLTAALAALSLVAGCIQLNFDSMAAFYLAPGRVWELLAGALLAMGALPASQRPMLRQAAAWGGLALIGGAMLGFSEHTPFPGLAALAPVLGTMLVIWAGGGGASPVGRWLASAPMVFVGKISYSLYLWHFPALAFVAYLALGKPTTFASVLAVAASIVLAILSWRFVEQPARKGGARLSHRTVAVATAVAAVALVDLAIAGNVTSGFPGRANLAAIGLNSVMPVRSQERDRCFTDAPGTISDRHLCALGAQRTNQPSFVLWGDSHGEALRPALDVAAAQHKRVGVFAGQRACPPLIGVAQPQLPHCPAINQLILDHILASPAIEDVILSARWGWWAEGTRYRNERGFSIRLQLQDDASIGNRAALATGLERTIAALAASGKRIWLVGPVPEIGFNVPNYFYLRSVGLARGFDPAPRRAEFESRQAHVLPMLEDAQRRHRVGLLWPHAMLCDAAKCRISSDGMMLYYDDDHLSTYGAESLAPLFAPALERSSAVTAVQ